MAKVVFIAHTNMIFKKTPNPDGFIQGFANAMIRMGNNVLCILCNSFPQEELIRRVVVEKPDLVVSFNNAAITEKFLAKTSCPIALVFSDSFPFIGHLNLIEKNQDRYYLIHQGLETVEQAKKYLKNFPENKQLYFGHASDVRKRDDIEQDIPVSFIGALGNWSSAPVTYLKKMAQFSKSCPIDMNDLKKKYLAHLDALTENPLTLQQYNDLPLWDQITATPFQNTLIMAVTCHKRYEILSYLTDLGLKIFSYPEGIIDVLTYNRQLFECYDFTLSTTLQDSEINFNRSKISLNLPHGQAQTGFSWRVCDILASNACLLSDPRKELIDLMKPYIDIPMFESAAEARELTIKLLKDDARRKEIVAASQQMVEENCRFEKKINLVSELTGIRLDNPEEKGTYGEVFKNISSVKIGFRNKCRLKLFAVWDRQIKEKGKDGKKAFLSSWKRKLMKKWQNKLVRKGIMPPFGDITGYKP